MENNYILISSGISEYERAAEGIGCIIHKILEKQIGTGTSGKHGQREYY